MATKGRRKQNKITGRARVQQMRIQLQKQAEKESRRKSRIPLWLRLLVAAAVILAMLLVLFRVRSFEASGNVRYTVEEIAEASGIAQGDGMLSVSRTQAAGKIIVELPYIRQVIVVKDLPGTVRFEVEECKAAAVVPSEYGNSWLISREGKLLEELDEDAETAYPVVTGAVLELPSPGDTAEFTDAARGEKAMAVIRAVSDAGLTGAVQTVSVDNLREVTLIYQDRIEVQLGTGEELAYQLQYMKKAVGELSATDTGVLDLSFSTGNQAVFRPMR